MTSGRLAGVRSTVGVLVLLLLGACAKADSSPGRRSAATGGEASETDAGPAVGVPKMSDRLPGAAPHPPELLERFETRLEEMGRAYGPRTRHLRPDGRAKYTNRLFLSSSPYLLQHAHNPVDWHPWGDEAFETAGRLGRPVLLSVGYSTCHWCHVMEEESFEDEEVARLMNEKYVAIKVDREERPDVDAIYMSAVQALTGGGG